MKKMDIIRPNITSGFFLKRNRVYFKSAHRAAHSPVLASVPTLFIFFLFLVSYSWIEEYIGNVNCKIGYHNDGGQDEGV